MASATLALGRLVMIVGRQDLKNVLSRAFAVDRFRLTVHPLGGNRDRFVGRGYLHLRFHVASLAAGHDNLFGVRRHSHERDRQACKFPPARP